MLNFLQLLAAKITAGWAGYVLTAAVATAVTGGGIVVLAGSGVVDQTSGLGTKIDLPFTFKPSTLGNLDQVYGTIAAGASAAVTGTGLQLPQLDLAKKISAVSNKIVAEANADKASLQRLSDNAQNLQGFKPSDDANKLASPTAGATTPTVPAATVTPPSTATPLPATATSTTTPTNTPTRTPIPTQTQTQTPTPTLTVTESPTITATPTQTLTPTPAGSVTITPTVTITSTPTSTATPSVNFGGNAGSTILTFTNIIPGGPATLASLNFSNTGAHPFNYTVSTSCQSGCNALWTDTTNGLQLAIDSGTVARSVTNPIGIPPGDTNLYTGPIAISNLGLVSGVNAGQPVNLGVTVWLPLGPTITTLNALTPNPGNALQGLSITVTFTWTGSE